MSHVCHFSYVNLKYSSRDVNPETNRQEMVQNTSMVEWQTEESD